jgi:hypothetical protein
MAAQRRRRATSSFRQAAERLAEELGVEMLDDGPEEDGRGGFVPGSAKRQLGHLAWRVRHRADAEEIRERVRFTGRLPLERPGVPAASS